MHASLVLAFVILVCNAAYPYTPHPYTLINTDVPCRSAADCLTHYNNSWCEAAGVMCIHLYCKLIPNYPCNATQTCQEKTKRCEDRECSKDSDCDNHLFCDGVEICSNSSSSGVCITDPASTNCHFTGGRCDEEAKQCYEPKVRLAWHNSEERRALLVMTTTPSNTSIITQLQVDVTALSTVAAFMFVVFVVSLAYVIGKSIRVGYKKKNYSQ